MTWDRHPLAYQPVHPTYRLTDRPPTPLETLVSARRIGLDAGLRYVYTGNVPGEKSENTYVTAAESF